jgi:hypothetical protein
MSGTDIRGHEMCRHSFRSYDVRSGYPEWALQRHPTASRRQYPYDILGYKTIVLRVLVPIVARLDDARDPQISIFIINVPTLANRLFLPHVVQTLL